MRWRQEGDVLLLLSPGFLSLSCFFLQLKALKDAPTTQDEKPSPVGSWLEGKPLEHATLMPFLN